MVTDFTVQAGVSLHAMQHFPLNERPNFRLHVFYVVPLEHLVVGFVILIGV